MIVFFVGVVGIIQFWVDGVLQFDLVFGVFEVCDGQVVFGEYFFGGFGSFVYVVVDEDWLQDVVDVLFVNDGVDGVFVMVVDFLSGMVLVMEDGIVLIGVLGILVFELIMVDGEVLLQGMFMDVVDFEEVVLIVCEFCSDFDDIDVLVGGVIVIFVDMNDVLIYDCIFIILVIFVVIMLILMLLLCLIFVLVLLIFMMVFLFGIVLGVLVLVFNGIFDFFGVDFVVLFFGFVFFVVFGIDYNIFLMIRVWEELKVYGMCEGIFCGLLIIGGVIILVGFVFVVIFVVFLVILILFFVQFVFIVVFGVLFDIFVVCLLFVFVLIYDIGKVIWWLLKLWCKGED